MWRSMVDGPLKVCVHRIRRSARTLGRRCRSIDVAANIRYMSVCRISVLVVDFCIFSGLRDARCSSSPPNLDLDCPQSSPFASCGSLIEARSYCDMRHDTWARVVKGFQLRLGYKSLTSLSILPHPWLALLLTISRPMSTGRCAQYR